MQTEEETMRKIASLLRSLAYPLRLEIILLLKEKGTLSFSDICKDLSGKYKNDQIWLSLKRLSKRGVIEYKEGYKKSHKVGRPQTCFFLLTEEGKVLARYLRKAIEEISKMGRKGLFYLQKHGFSSVSTIPPND